MKIRITTVDVGDGDAIVVSLEKGARKLVAIIDAGRSRHSEKVLRKIDDELKRVGKSSPDLVVVTHCDSDHIGGIPAVLRKYGRKIRELWIHDLGSSFDEDLQPLRKSLFSIFEAEEAQEFKTKLEPVIESLTELNNVVTLAKSIGIETREPFFDEHSFPGWPEIRVIGPSRDYYNTVFSKTESLNDFVLTEAQSDMQAESLNSTHTSANPCAQLPKRSIMQPTNRTSAIVKIVADGRSYLFTGDAEIESFLSLPNYEKELSGVFWLKSPHHGSINNISEELIKLMRPKYVHISGNNYVDRRVVDCLKQKKCNVSSTISGDLVFPTKAAEIMMLIDSAGSDHANI